MEANSYSGYAIHPPDTSTPGRPAYGATCYSSISSIAVTQYDNSSSSGLMTFSTAGQAYAHPFDGFAMDQAVILASNSTSIATTSISNTTVTAQSTNQPTVEQPPMLSGGAIAGIIIGAVIALSILLTGFICLLKHHKQSLTPLEIDRGDSYDKTAYGSPPTHRVPLSEKALPPTPGYIIRSKISELPLSSEKVESPLEIQSTRPYSERQELPGRDSQLVSELDASESLPSHHSPGYSSTSMRLSDQQMSVRESLSPSLRGGVSPLAKPVSPVSVLNSGYR
jgi:hypothetical protein